MDNTLSSQKNKKVLVFGTFDILHEGHLSLFEQAREYGNLLMVVVARDVTVEKVKNKKADFNEKTRLKNIQKCPLVDHAVLGGKSNPYDIIKRLSPDVICLGYDQRFFTKNLKNKIKEMGIKAKVVRLNAYFPDVFHSSLIKQAKANARINSFN